MKKEDVKKSKIANSITYWPGLRFNFKSGDYEAGFFHTTEEQELEQNNQWRVILNPNASGFKEAVGRRSKFEQKLEVKYTPNEELKHTTIINGDDLASIVRLTN